MSDHTPAGGRVDAVSAFRHAPLMDMNLGVIDQRVAKLAELHGERLVPAKRPGAPAQEELDRRRALAFLLLCAKTVLNLGDDQTLACLTDGGHDASVDAVHIGDLHDSEFTVTLFQAKYSTKTGAEKRDFPGSEIDKLLLTLGVLFDPDRALELNPRLGACVEEIRSLIRDGNLPHVRVILCSTGQRWNRQAQAKIDASKLPSAQVRWEHVNPDVLVQMLLRPLAVEETIKLSGPATLDHFNLCRVLVGKVAVGVLKDLFDRHGDQLLDRNIRRFLGVGTNWVNQAIQKSLLSLEQRERFYFYNNGVTMVCSKFRHNGLQQEGWQVRAEGLQVINGGQTCWTIHQTLGDHPDEDFSRTFVLLRIYELDPQGGDLVSEITYANNSQSPVDLSDLRANDERQRKLELAVQDLGYVYKRKRDAAPEDEQVIPLPLAAEAIFAIWRRRPHQAKFHRGELFRLHYDLVFSDTLNAAQLVLAVLILRQVEKSRRAFMTGAQSIQEYGDPYGVGDVAPAYLPYATFFLAMLMGDELLRDLDLTLDALDHRMFPRALDALSERGGAYYDRAQSRLETGLRDLGVLSASLQRLAGAFRRGDLLQALPPIDPRPISLPDTHAAP